MVGARGVAGRPTSADRLACGEAEVARRRALRVAFGSGLWVPVGTSPRALGPLLGFPNHPLVSVSCFRGQDPGSGWRRFALVFLPPEDPDVVCWGWVLSLRAGEVP